MNKTIWIALGFCAMIAITYCLVLYGPDKSLFNKIERIDTEQQKNAVSLQFEMMELHSDMNILKHDYDLYKKETDSLLQVERTYRIEHEHTLDSLVKSRNVNAPKRLPLK